MFDQDDNTYFYTTLFHANDILLFFILGVIEAGNQCADIFTFSKFHATTLRFNIILYLILLLSDESQINVKSL